MLMLLVIVSINYCYKKKAALFNFPIFTLPITVGRLSGDDGQTPLPPHKIKQNKQN